MQAGGAWTLAKGLHKLAVRMHAYSSPPRQPSLHPGSVNLAAAVYTAHLRFARSHPAVCLRPCSQFNFSSRATAASATVATGPEGARPEGVAGTAAVATEDEASFLASSETTFSSLGLVPAVAEALTAAGFGRPAQVQVSFCFWDHSHACMQGAVALQQRTMLWKYSVHYRTTIQSLSYLMQCLQSSSIFQCRSNPASSLQSRCCILSSFPSCTLVVHYGSAGTSLCLLHQSQKLQGCLAKTLKLNVILS